ncbi:ACT domain-containing protein [Nocardioides bizhenqiangii]|uniref:ACT domain-containing protein n=1 Tax=Nocardioides bizhenqiangii TaxID=3095076 RepID=A0ABZ0ZWG1_9ACTN|nr:MULTISPECIES: ACT domain-containing protein [unclassified Nocardioides]MDZ5622143.1 ACT domain-containing protein [Nocardioides sp. HM23]WQQ28676.1 ACT domain-containing protein [Nocardioides sp. HM61]
MTSYTLSRFPETLAVVQLGPGAEIPTWAESSSIFSVTATATETSIVCAARSVPAKARHDKPYTAFVVVPEAGSADFDLSSGVTGVLVALLAPLADAGVSVFALSTFGTDWILVPKNDADKAEEAWRRSGHAIAPAVPA